MRAWLGKATLWTLGVVGTAIAIMAQVPLPDLKAHLATYIDAAGLNYVAGKLTPAVDRWLTLFGVTIALGAATALFLLWRRKSLSATSDWLPLQEAAQFVYDETRNTIIAHLTRHDPDDNPLVAMATLLIVDRTIEVRGRVRWATVPDEINHSIRKNMCVRSDLETIGYGGVRDPNYYGVQVKGNGLQNFIDRQLRMDQEFLSPSEKNIPLNKAAERAYGELHGTAFADHIEEASGFGNAGPSTEEILKLLMFNISKRGVVTGLKWPTNERVQVPLSGLKIYPEENCLRYKHGDRPVYSDLMTTQAVVDEFVRYGKSVSGPL